MDMTIDVENLILPMLELCLDAPDRKVEEKLLHQRPEDDPIQERLYLMTDLFQRLCNVEQERRIVNRIFVRAAERGAEAIMRLYLTALKRVNNEAQTSAIFDGAMVAAAGRGQEAIVRLCHDEWGATDVIGAMVKAAEYGHEAIVRLCHDEWTTGSVTVADYAMSAAARGGQAAIVRLCHDEWGATNINEAMAKAAYGGHEDIVRLCFKWGADDVNRALIEAVKGKHEGIVQLCHDELGANDPFAIQMAIKAATDHPAIASLCRRWSIPSQKKATARKASGVA